jgi:hypothetical protein
MEARLRASHGRWLSGYGRAEMAGAGEWTILLDVDADGADARGERHGGRAAVVLHREPLEHHLQHERTAHGALNCWCR